MKLFSLFKVIYPLVLATSFAVSATTYSKFECPGNITFGSNSRIMEYVKDYPDCTVMKGGLLIQDGVTSLMPLAKLQTIIGPLRIIQTRDLWSLKGLDQLKYVESIEITNTSISDISFPNLQQLTGVTSALDRQAEAFNSRFNAVEHSGKIIIEGNEYLTKLSTFDQITKANEISINFNGQLSTISGFNNLTQVGCKVDIAWNDSLKQVEGFNRLQRVKEDGCKFDYLSTLSFYENPKLTKLRGFSSLVHVSSLRLTGNEQLTSIANDTFSQLRTIDDIMLVDKTRLTELSNFHNINSIGLNLMIQDNSELTNLAGLEQLKLVNGVISIDNNPKLADIMALSGLKEVCGLEIDNEPKLTELVSFSNITSLKKGLVLKNNDKLESLTGFEHVTELSGPLDIESNPDLASLSGLQHLNQQASIESKASSISCDRGKLSNNLLYINDNDTLASIDALSNYHAQVISLQVNKNFSLSTLKGIENITLSKVPSQHSELKSSVIENYNLADCSALCPVLRLGVDLTLSNYRGNCMDRSELICASAD